MLIDKKELQTLVPQQGKMCLLDGVLSWDALRICCQSDSHRLPGNPLRLGARLSAVHAFEYGAQAVAVHGGLRAREAEQPIQPGYLAALRDGELFVDYLDGVDDTLIVQASMRLSGAGSFIYDTQVTARDVVLAKARITVILTQERCKT